MIYTIGYGGMGSNSELLRIVTALDAVLVDVRSYPSGRVKRGFSKRDLSEALAPNRYLWWGDVLGGRGPGITAKGLEMLSLADQGDAPLVLMCAEEAPGDCHRHQIALQLGRPVFHICDDEVVLATELERAIQADDDYTFEPVAELLRAPLEVVARLRR